MAQRLHIRLLQGSLYCAPCNTMPSSQSTILLANWRIHRHNCTGQQALEGLSRQVAAQTQVAAQPQAEQ